MFIEQDNTKQYKQGNFLCNTSCELRCMNTGLLIQIQLDMVISLIHFDGWNIPKLLNRQLRVLKHNSNF